MKQGVTISDLAHYRRLHDDIKLLREKLAQRREKLYQAKSPKLDDMPKGGDMTRSQLEMAVVDLVDLELEIEDKECLAEELRRKIEKQIAAVPGGRARAVLRARHINLMSWSLVAECTGSSMTAEGVRKYCRRLTETYFPDKGK